MGQVSRELIPTRSAAHALGAELRRRRVDRGLSQATLGELVHHSGALVGKIEKAERFPSAEFCELVDEVLDTGGVLTQMRPRVDPRAESEYICFVEPSWTVAASLRALRELTGGSVDRRDFLALTGTALAATATSWSNAVTIPEPAFLRGERRLGGATLDRLTQRLADLRVLDDELGGTVLRHLASAELRWLTGLADSADLKDTEQRRVFDLITEAARLCGWLHLDADHHAAAQAYYVTALRCSASAADPLAGANVLAGMSWQATLTGHPTEALGLLDTAERQVGRNASPKLRALLASRRARAHARAGDTRACGRALNEAENALSSSEGGQFEPDWIYFFDEAELAAQAGSCWVDLRQPARARPLLDGALRSMGAQYVRDRTIYHARSAQTSYHSGELDLACAELTSAAVLARRTGSIHSVNSIRIARRAMSDHDSERAVRELDETLVNVVGQVV